MPQIIINGGDPLPGCPESWEQANAWEDAANEPKSDYVPHWKFDCGFKLDFDGGLLDVSSRFYPPKDGYGPKWDGKLVITLAGDMLVVQEFECDTLDQLKAEVEAYVEAYTRKVWDAIALICNVDASTEEAIADA